MAAGSLTGTSKNAEEVYSELEQRGVSKAEAQILVGQWILANAGATQKTFAFKTDFAAEDEDCEPQFDRSFVHRDWVDGEDVVQAEQTAGEDGFNLRFHRIEADLDGLGRDVAQLFACMSSMRASLRQLLDEIQTELNLVYKEIARCCDESDRPIYTGPRIVGGGSYVGATTYFGQDVHVFHTEEGTVMLPMAEAIKVDPFVNPRVERVQGFAEFLAGEAVREVFADGGPVTQKAFVETFGDETLPGGEKVRDALDIVPPGSRFKTAAALLDGLAGREGAAIRSSGVEDESIAVVFGLKGSAKVAEAPVDRLQTIPADARTALVKAGISVVGKLGVSDPDQVAAVLRRHSVDVDAADVAGWLGVAKVMVNAR